ncbi:UDP-N-acetylglucosamine 2-epimerase [Alphaproteobacteria bacterium]|nr:UDP-N-acetylglucosamine 2-epimerase [Alphaproteobacteria bacterium]
MKNICVVTGTRAEYGLLYWIMREIEASPELSLQVVATGMHLSHEFQNTSEIIENDNFKIDKKIPILLSSDSPSAISKSIGLGLIGFGDAFDELKPDLVLLLGDRFEILSAAVSAMVHRIPIAHIHGGEATEGSIDEPIRHSITKMSQIHFVAAPEFAKRVTQMGEQPETVYVVGATGLDGIAKLEPLTKSQLEKELDFSFGGKNLLVTFHPVTLEAASSQDQFANLLDALDQFPEVNLIFTMPNADTDGRTIMDQIREYCEKRENAKYFNSLGQKKYLSALKYIDGVIGNSSSGLIEAPSFGIGTINIGDRQKGRLRGPSIIDCSPKVDEIVSAIEILYQPSFRKSLVDAANPYGTAGASGKIVQILRQFDFSNSLKKTFYNLS